MRRTITWPILILGLLLFVWINLPKSAADHLRSIAVRPFYRSGVDAQAGTLARLQLENQQLRAQFGRLAEKTSADAISAKVIYRDPTSWSSSLWVNVGEADSRTISRNSPVMADGALVGVVDYVGRKQSRIRLITDSGLSPSVRVVRGAVQNMELSAQVQRLLRLLEKRDDLEGKADLVKQLNTLQQQSGKWEDGYLATGEVHGSSAPFWRSRSPILKGVGFHYDSHESVKGVSAPLLKEGDFVVTSGLDGVFPAGLHVGMVCHVEAPKEGAYAFDLEVRPFTCHLNDLQTVLILPPVSE